MKKILFLQYVKGFAGSENYLLNFLPALPKASNGRYAGEFLCVYKQENSKGAHAFGKMLEDAGIQVHYLVDDFGFSLKTLLHIRKLVKERGISMLQSNLIHADMWCAALKALRLVSIPSLSAKHGYDEKFSNLYGFITVKAKGFYANIIKLTDRFHTHSLFISKGLANFFVWSGLTKADKKTVVQYGFDLTGPNPENKGKYRFAPQQLIIVGRLIEYKGHRFVLEILNNLVLKFPDLKLVILGSGPHEAAIKQLIADKKLEEYVLFPGFARNVIDYLVDSDAFLMLSTSEGFGLVTLEAMRAAIPVVGFDVPATNEIVEDKVSGFLVPPFDTAILQERIEQLLQDPAAAREMGANGYQRLLKYFSLERMARETVAVYDRLLA